MKANAMYRAVKKFEGSCTDLARAVNLHLPKGRKPCHRQSVECWLATGLPPVKWCVPLEKATGIPRHEFRPDVYLEE